MTWPKIGTTHYHAQLGNLKLGFLQKWIGCKCYESTTMVWLYIVINLTPWYQRDIIDIASNLAVYQVHSVGPASSVLKPFVHNISIDSDSIRFSGIRHENIDSFPILVWGPPPQVNNSYSIPLS